MLRCLVAIALVHACGSFHVPATSPRAREFAPLPRRAALALPLAALPLLTNAGAALLANSPAPALAEEQRDLQYRSGSDTAFASQPGLQGKDYGKSSMSYSDFTKTRSGLLFKDGKAGGGKTPKKGDRVVVDWTGYTIGYFGRPFETKKLQELNAKASASRTEVDKWKANAKKSFDAATKQKTEHAEQVTEDDLRVQTACGCGYKRTNGHRKEENPKD